MYFDTYGLKIIQVIALLKAIFFFFFHLACRILQRASMKHEAQRQQNNQKITNENPEVLKWHPNEFLQKFSVDSDKIHIYLTKICAFLQFKYLYSVKIKREIMRRDQAIPSSDSERESEVNRREHLKKLPNTSSHKFAGEEISILFEQVNWRVYHFLCQLTEYYEKSGITYDVHGYHQMIVRLLAPIELKGIVEHEKLQRYFKDKIILKRILQESSNKIKDPLNEYISNALYRSHMGEEIMLPRQNNAIRINELTHKSQNGLRNEEKNISNENKLKKLIERLKKRQLSMKNHYEEKLMQERLAKPQQPLQNLSYDSSLSSSENELDNKQLNNDQAEKMRRIRKIMIKNMMNKRGMRKKPSTQVRINQNVELTEPTIKRKIIRRVKGKPFNRKEKSFGLEEKIVLWFWKEYRNGEQLSLQKIGEKARQLDTKQKFKACKAWQQAFVKRNQKIRRAFEQSEQSRINRARIFFEKNKNIDIDRVTDYKKLQLESD